MSDLEGTYLSSYFMIEETETQSANVMLSGRMEAQSWHRGFEKQFAGFSRSNLQASSLLRTQNQVLKLGLCVTCSH